MHVPDALVKGQRQALFPQSHQLLFEKELTDLE